VRPFCDLHFFLACNRQAWQVGSSPGYSLWTYSPLIISCGSKKVPWEFLVGMAPITLTMFISTLVPCTDSAPCVGGNHRTS